MGGDVIASSAALKTRSLGHDLHDLHQLDAPRPHSVRLARGAINPQPSDQRARFARQDAGWLAERIRQTRDAVVSVVYLVSGEVDLQIDRREILLRGDDFLIVDLTSPCCEVKSLGAELLVLSVGRAAFRRAVPMARRGFVHHIAGGAPLARMAGRICLEAVSTVDADREFVAETVLTFIGRMMTEDAAPLSRHAHGLLFSIKQYLLAHLADEDLTPATVAQEFRVSHRYVNKLFSAEGCSVTAWMQRRRLERAADLLGSVGGMRQSITDIAFACGFRDPSSFSRAFRTRFGCPPREFRDRGRRA